MDLFGAYVQKSAHIFIAFIDLKPHIFKNAIKRGEKKRKKKTNNPHKQISEAIILELK